MEETIKERLTSYLRYKGINKSEFGRMIGVSSAYISSIRKSIQPDKVEKIASSFPDLDVSWLVTGEGEMIKSGYVSQNAKGDNNTQIAGNGNNVNMSTIDKALDEIAEQRKLVEKSHELFSKSQEQIDRLLSIIEDMNKQKSAANE